MERFIVWLVMVLAVWMACLAVVAATRSIF